jgi:hypothetical protein
VAVPETALALSDIAEFTFDPVVVKLDGFEASILKTGILEPAA